MQSNLHVELHQIRSRHWWYRGRRTVLGAILAPYLSSIPDGNLLDLGSGPATNHDLIGPLGRPIFALDLSAEALNLSKRSGYGTGVLADAVSIPFRDESFVMVIATDLLEHIEDDSAALAEISRTLKPDGLVLVVVPAFQNLWGWQDEVSGHHRRYSPSEVRRLVEDGGLEVVRSTCMNILLAGPILAARKLLKRTHLPARSENRLLPEILNPLLYAIFAAETPVVSRWDVPYGTSVVCVARRR